MFIGVNFIKALVKIIDNLDISHLILAKNQIGEEGITLLEGYLRRNRTVIHLDLSQNEIT